MSTPQDESVDQQAQTSDNDAPERDSIPNPQTGVGIGADSEPDTFEPEETPE